MTQPSEKPLTGGDTTPVSKLGGHVLREAGPWTATVQSLLHHLRDNGITWCPEPHGWTADGREQLTYIKGKVPTAPLPDWVYDEATLVTAATWLRQLHDLTTDFDRPDYAWRSPRRSPGEVICHNDFGPSNFVFRDHHLVGVIDWDQASPGPRLWDVAQLAYRLVPLVGPGHPDAPTTSKDLIARLNLLLATYGTTASIPEVLSTVGKRLDDLAAGRHARALQAKKDERHVFVDQAARYEADAAFLRSLVGG